MVGQRGHGEVGAVEHVEELCPELHVESLRDASNRVVLEQGEVKVRQSRSDQDVTAGVPAQVEALREHAK